MKRNQLLFFIYIILLFFIVSCNENDSVVLSVRPTLSSFRIEAINNPLYIQDDIVLEVDNGLIEGRVPYLSDLSSLVASFSFEGKAAYVDGVEQISGVTKNDFTKDVIYKVVAEDGTEEAYYVVSIKNFTGIPVVKISTHDIPILDKDTWIEADMTIDGMVAFENYSDKAFIKGRGNSTWAAIKKPYALKLSKKAELLNMPKHKRWVLLANYYDKTSLRNAIAFYMGEQYTRLDYTPKMQYVELFLNEVYLGTYQLGEQIKIDENRVNVTDNGYLLEIDSKAAPEDIVFKSPLGLQFNIKEPGLEVESEKYNYIRQFVTDAENALYGENFLNSEFGYRKFIDIESFVDWYLINEITKNNDASFFTSCYMNLSPEGKLKMGPLWDFDLAFGNVNYNNNNSPEGFWIKESVWISRLFEDPSFVMQVKERFNDIMSRKVEIMQYINDLSGVLRWSVLENNAKWGTLYQSNWPNYAVWGSYRNEVQYLKNWLHQRFEWLEKAFAEL